MTKPTLNWRGFVLAIALTLSSGLVPLVRAAGPDALDAATPTTAIADENVVDEQEDELDLNDALGLEVRGSLRRTAGGEYVRVEVENLIDEAIVGPVYLVVRDTGIEGLTPTEPKLVLEAGRKLAASRTSRPVTVRFAAEERLTAAQRAGLDLDYEFVRELDTTTAESESESATANDSDVATLNVKYGLAADATNFPGQTFGPRELERVSAIKDREEKQLFAVEGVHGVGVSTKDGRLVVRVLIDRLGIVKDLPRTVGGIPVDPKVAARPSIAPPTGLGRDAEAFATLGKFRPLRMGISINTFVTGNNAGTLGFYAADRNGTVYGVTNRHVLDDFGTTSRLGQNVVQPGRLDGGTSGDDVGSFSQAASLRFVGGTSVDAALVGFKPGLMINSTTPTGIRIAAEPMAAFPGLRVQKHGRTTDLTEGNVGTVNLSVNVNGYGGRTVLFTNQVSVTGINGTTFSRSGDSGSLIFAKSSKRPVALLFAGNGTTTYGNDVRNVMGAFGLTEVVNYDTSTNFLKTYTIRLWKDLDGDGIQDSSEPTLRNHEVWMQDWSGGKRWTSAVSDYNGYVTFRCREDQWYRFWVAPPSGYTHSPQDRGSNDALDSDAGSDHFSPWYKVSTSTSNVDFGFVPPPTHTVNVWRDTDGDGVREWGEPSLDGVKVWIYDWTDKTWNSKVSSGGKVTFDVKPDRWYRYWVSPSNGMEHSPTGDGKTNDFGSDHYSPWYKVAGSRSDIDAGFTLPPTRTYTVKAWHDGNRNGTRDAGESGLSGVRIHVLDYATNTWSSRTTNGSGEVSFPVKEGQWYMFWTAPTAGMVHTAANVGSDATDSDFATNHYSPWFKVQGNRSDIAAGFH